MKAAFLKAGDSLLPVKDITHVDISRMKEGILVIEFQNVGGVRTVECEGFDALEAIMTLRPSAVEGQRFRHPKWSWFVHNMIGHPLMQILAIAGFHDRAIWVHDVTVPKPVGLPKQPAIQNKPK